MSEQTSRFVAAALLGMALLTPAQSMALPLKVLNKMDRQTWTKTLKDTFETVGNGTIERLVSSVDSKGKPKTGEQRARDLKRAPLVKKAVEEFSPSEIAIRIKIVSDSDDSVHLESVLGRYILDAVKEMEAAESARKKPQREYLRD